MAVLGQYAEAAGINVSKLTRDEVIELDRLCMFSAHNDLKGADKKRYQQLRRKADGQ